MGREPDVESLLGLVGSIYEAAFEPERWNGVLPRIVSALNAHRGFMGFTRTTGARSVSTVSHEVDDDFVERWQGEFAGFDPWLDRSGPIPTGQVVQGVEVIPWEDLCATEVHRAVFRGKTDDLICASVANHGDAFDFVTVHKGMRDGPFAAVEVRAMQLLAPHLVRAAQLHDKLSVLSEERAAHAALLERLPFGVVFVDPRGRITGANPEAERILRSGDGIGVHSGFLHVAQPDAGKRLASAIAGAAAEADRIGADAGALLTVSRRTGGRYQVLVAPLPAPSRERIFRPLAPRASALVVISDPEAAPEPAAEALARLFGLTAALGRLAAALASGLTLAEYAEQAAITKGTARWHLKEPFARTGTSRQAELVRVLLSSVAQLRDVSE